MTGFVDSGAPLEDACREESPTGPPQGRPVQTRDLIRRNKAQGPLRENAPAGPKDRIAADHPSLLGRDVELAPSWKDGPVSKVLTFLVLAGLMLFISILPATSWAEGEGDGRGRWGADYFPNVPLITQDGKVVRFYDDLIKGKTVAIELIYTRCKDLCPLETARLAQVRRLLGERVGTEIFFYSISIDPQHDTPENLKAYADKFRAGPGWLFLTGKKVDIDRISRKLGLYSEPDPANRDGHTPYLLVGHEPTGQWMRNAAVDNPQFLATVIGNWLSSWKAFTPARSYTEVRNVEYDRGAYLFRTRCAACHTTGRGDSVGPDLAGVTKLRERGWLKRFILYPDRMLEEGDPIALALYAKYKEVPMPRQALTDAEVEELLGFLDTRMPPTSSR